MRKIVITTTLAAAALAACAQMPKPSRQFTADPSGVSLVWSEEFEGDSLDRSVWNVEINGSGCGNNELEHYVDSPENVSLSGGNLVITARRREFGNHAFTSGRLNTLGKFDFTYGIVECSVKLPSTADGLWPAIWFMGSDIDDNGWPLCGETDLLEMGHADGIAAGKQSCLFNGALHYGTGEHVQQVGVGSSPVSLQDGRYHRFYLVWTPEAINMYVDEVEAPYLSVDISDRDNPASPGYYFHKPNFILLNLAVGGDFTGIHDPAAVTALDPEDEASMYVDYIRIYLPNNQLITEK